MELSSSDFDLWELVSKIANEAPSSPPGRGVAIGGPVANMWVPLPPGQKGAGFEISIYPRASDAETGLIGISRVTAVADHVTEKRFLGRYHHKELSALCEAEGMRSLAEQAKQAAKEPLKSFSMIRQKEDAPNIWIETLYLINVSDEPLLIENVWFSVEKAGTTEQLRKAEVTWPPKMKRIDGKKQIKLLPQRTWLALSTEWDALPDLAGQSCRISVKCSSDNERPVVPELSRYIEAEAERH